MSTNFWQDILDEAHGEQIEHVVIGEWGGSGYENDPRDSFTQDLRGTVLTAEQARPLLNYDYDCGFGLADCHAVYAYTRTRVLFVSEYDGSTTVNSVPRNPEPGLPSVS